MRRSGLALVLAALGVVVGSSLGVAVPQAAAAVSPPVALPDPRPWLATPTDDQGDTPERTPEPTRRPARTPAAIGPTDRTTYDLTARYDVAVSLDWDRRAVRVDTRIEIENTSGGPVGRLMLNTVAPAIGAMRLDRLTVDGTRVAPRISGQTLIVRLPTPLPEGGTTRVRVAYRGRVGLSTAGHDWMWAKGNDIINLYRFIPWISRRVPFQRDNHGDPFVTPTSPHVRVRLTADRALTYATSGERVATDGRTQTFEARDVRDFNVTASPRYRVLSRRTKDGDTLIRVYTVSGRAELLMRSAQKAYRAYEAWIGPYPWPIFNVAESAGGYAMESPALIWMPMKKFTDADVRYLTAHETGHQWFYGAVGNDQTTDMFADEAMTDFISRRLVGRLRSSYCPDDRLDRRLYDYTGACYFEVIYVQGGRLIDSIRRHVGDGPFWTAVRAYYADNLFGVSDNRTLLEALRQPAGDWALRRYRTRFPSLYPG